MKKFVTLMLAAILGGFVFKAMDVATSDEKPKNQFETNTKPHVNARFAANYGFTEHSLANFREASEKSVEGVVHVKSIIVEDKVYYQYKKYVDPVEEFFWGGWAPKYYYKEPRKYQQKQQSSGSGVIISPDGYIVTNNHVIENASEVEITLFNNKTYKAKVIGTDTSTDIALLKIEGENFPHIQFGNSDDVYLGDWVLAVGNPFNLASTVTAGIVSAKARNINILQSESAIESFIQTDAAVNPGNSGGALVNITGELIGVNTAIATPTGTYAGYSFAVPSNIVKKVVEDLINFGTVQRGYLGVEISDLTPEIEEEYGIDESEGVFVGGVAPKGAAEEAGIEAGDVITEINGNKISRKPELLEQVGQHRPGDKIMLTISRKGKSIQKQLTLQNYQGKAAIVKRDAESIMNVLGVEFKDLTKREKEKLGINYGVVVASIGEGKIAEQTNIKEGFIILKVDNQLVSSVEDLISILSKKKGGTMIEGVYPNYYGRYYYAIGL